MQTVIHRRDEAISREQVMESFKTELDKRKEAYGGEDSIQQLMETYDKMYTANYIVQDPAELKYVINQGDIVIHHESSKYYQEVIGSVTDLRPAKGMNLQEGTSITGDHRIVPMEGANVTIEDGRFLPKDSVTKRRLYECKIVWSDKPILITHREHGNIALLPGRYLVYSQINTKTQRRVLD